MPKDVVLGDTKKIETSKQKRETKKEIKEDITTKEKDVSKNWTDS